MIKHLVKIQSRIFSYDQPFIIGLITILIQTILGLFIAIVIFPCLIIKHTRHFYLKIKQPQKHISGTFETYQAKDSNMIHTHFNNQCSCGRNNAPEDIFDIFYQSLDDIGG